MTQVLDAAEFFNRVNPRAWNEDYPNFKDIIDLALPKLSNKGPWLAGGAIRRMVTGQDLRQGDFDIFCADADQYDQVIDFYMKDRRLPHSAWTRKDHVDEFTTRIYDPGDEVKVQVIKLHFYPDAISLINDFDFTCCMAAYDGVTVALGDYFLFDNSRRRLAVNKIKYPVAALRRLLKYQKQGYYACSGCLQEIANAIHQMDPIDFRENKVLYVD